MNSKLPMTVVHSEDSEALQHRLSSALASGARLNVVECISSTNAVLKESAADSHECFLLALEQTAGVGRRGGIWQSPPSGNLYLSYCIHSDQPIDVLSRWPLGVAVTLAEHLHKAFGIDCQIKWPNDLYLQGQKCGGILLETVHLSVGKCAVVVGVGINIVSCPSFEVLQRPVTCLNDHVETDLELASVAEVTMAALSEACRLSDAEVKTLLSIAWPPRDFLNGKKVYLEALGADFGIARGLSPEGGLQIEFSGKLETLYSGEVSLGHVESERA